ncbi:MAG: MerR family DNA-binding protein [Nevskiales bacterium]|nr:MerR family DNA-binding protein [Nevskiales bacterium]
MNTLSVSQLASQAGVGIDTVRYYERAGLLPKPPRRPSGYRAYPQQSVERLRFIRRAKALGFSLEEIAELLALSDRSGDAEQIRRLAATRLAEVERRIAELQRVRDGLHRLVDACPGHDADTRDCPILSALNGEVTL